jgi:PKD repeat protein
VNARPVAFLTGGATICPAQSSVIRVNMLAGTGPFTVEIANHGIVNNYVSGADIVVTPAATTTYSLIRVRDANNCEVVAPSPNLNGTATVIVSDLPVITSFTPSPAVCEFTLANFKVTATGTNLTYQWFVNQGSGFNAVIDGGTYFGALTPTLQIFNTVRTMNGYVYHVVVSGCGTNVTSADATFTVNTAPELTLHPKDSTICLGQNAIMEADATGTNVTWQWFVNKGSGFVLSVDDANFSGSTTRTLTITNAQASHNNFVFRAVATGVCGVPVNTNFAVLRVINPPAVTLQPVARTICENGSTSFLGNGTGYTSLQWQVFSGGVWTNLTDNATYIGTNTQQLAIMNAPVALNTNQYRLALITGCATTYSNAATLTVNANPVVDFSAIDPIAACGGVPIVINGNPTGGSGIYTQHRWTGDVGPLNSYTVQSPTFNSFITGTYNLNYRVTDNNGCTSNDDVAVTVDSPSAQFTQDADYGCTPLNVTFTKDMTGLAKWWWNFDDGSPLDSLNANPVHTFVNSLPGSIAYYNVKLKVRSTGGCYAEFTSTITVYPAVNATFSPNVPIICSGNSITFTALSGATKYFWEYGDGASGYATNISTHMYINLTPAPVVHTVKLTTTSFYNCVDVKTFDITVMPVPIPQFTAVPLTQVFNAAGNPVTFTNATNNGTWNWLWNFGDNTTSTDMNPVHSYTNVGTFTVTLHVSNANCSDSVKHSVSVVPPAPVANFDSIPSGCAPLYVNINNTSTNTAVPGTTYHWDFGDGSISTAKNPTYTYFTAGTYRIELVVTGPGGTSMKTQVVNAYASPKAYFEITPVMVYVNDERVRCFNLSQGATSYLWDFGDGDTSKVKEPYHRYMEEGVFDITLWAYSSNGCSDQYTLSPAVTVEPVGELRFSTVFMPNKTGPIERTDLPTGGVEADQFFYPPIRQKVLNYKLQIFNRLGVLIFQSNDINVPWNGYYKNKLCQQGVYVWYVEGKYADGKPFKLVGNVTLLQ